MNPTIIETVGDGHTFVDWGFVVVIVIECHLNNLYIEHLLNFVCFQKQIQIFGFRFFMPAIACCRKNVFLFNNEKIKTVRFNFLIKK